MPDPLDKLRPVFDDTKECDGPQCRRRVHGAVMYCCCGCRMAAESDPIYVAHADGPLGHTARCNAREAPVIDPECVK